MKSDVTNITSLLYTKPTTQPTVEASFEFGDFQGSSTTSATNTSTASTWPTSNSTFTAEDNWASFESAFPSSKPAATSVTSNIPSSSTQNCTSTETAAAIVVDSSGPEQSAVFDKVTHPLTSVDSSNVDRTTDNDMAVSDGDKYAAFASLVTTTTTHGGEDNDEFGNFEGSQPLTTGDSDGAKVQYFTTQVSVYSCCYMVSSHTVGGDI